MLSHLITESAPGGMTGVGEGCLEERCCLCTSLCILKAELYFEAEVRGASPCGLPTYTKVNCIV